MSISAVRNHLISSKPVVSIIKKALQFNKEKAPYQTDNAFLEGVFAPVKEEVFTTNLVVHGKIPPSLNGLFLRTGPNPLEVSNPATYSWFVGDGMVHGIRLKEGKALWYKNRYVGNHAVHDKLGRQRIQGQQRGAVDIANTNIVGYAGKIWALVESGPLPVAMDAELNSLHYGLFNSKDNYPFTAHPHIDPDTGELHAICYDVLLPMQIYYQVIDTQGQVKKRIAIPVQHGPMMHDCSMTRSYMVIFDLPITFSLERVRAGAEFPYAWNAKHTARVGLLPKQGGAKDIRWFTVDPCCVFHSCNAYDADNGEVIVDVVVHEKSLTSSIQGPIEPEIVQLERWTLGHVTGQVQRKILSNIPQEFPRLDERLVGKPYRYAYAISLGEGGKPGDLVNTQPNYLLKHDLDTGALSQHFYGEGFMTSEVIFVPKNAQSLEDEGWLISYVHALDSGPSRVVILDAQKIDQAPQAVIELPVRVPLGFHANWVGELA